MFISEAAAHSIVQEIKEITGHNINIMDAAGVIFASTDPERIGQRHLGACQVLEQGMPRLVVQEDDGRPGGARRGINLPIQLDGGRVDEAYVNQVIEALGLEQKLDRLPNQLSGGQQQRVAIARALALHPDILCFDEPTSALDPELTGEVLKVIRALAEQKTTMMIVTHEMAFARDVADQVIFMDGGVIVEQGDARQVIENPQQERTRQFLSRYSEN